MSTRRQTAMRRRSGRLKMWLRVFLFERTLLVLSVLFAISLIGILLFIHQLQSRLVQQAALENVEVFSEAIREFRTLYTREVVQRVRGSGVEVTHDFHSREGAIPLPATLSMMLGKRLGETGSGVRTFLYSGYPFPWREEENQRLWQDGFVRKAWGALNQNPNIPVYEFTQHEGRDVLRYATADLMRPSCIQCHNTHPQSPKVNWKENDVRGVLEVIHPINIFQNQIKSDIQVTFILLFSMAMFVLFFLGKLLGRLEISYEEAHNSVQAKNDFLATMSHEIRTPIHSVLGLCELLSRTSLDVDQREKLKAMELSGERLLRLISDLLDFTKIESGAVELLHQPFDLAGSIRAAWISLEDRARRKGLEMNLNLPGNVPRYLVADRGRFLQVLINLVDNAIKYTETGHISLTVECQVRGHKAHINLVVSDTGIGVSDSQKITIFERFHQIDVARKNPEQGVGLGLAISKQLVALMGGTLEMESVLGKGSRFIFNMEMGVVSDQEVALLEIEKGAGEELKKERLSGMRILVVEDDPFGQVVARGLLEDAGCKVDMAENGQVALEHFTRQRYDLIFMDCQMPVLDGWNATREIRSREVLGKRTPIVAMTADSLDESRRKCLDVGMDDYITKPFRAEELIECILRLTS